MNQQCRATGSPASDGRDVEGNWGFNRGVEMMVGMDEKNESAKMILIWNKNWIYILCCIYFVLLIFRSADYVINQFIGSNFLNSFLFNLANKCLVT